MTELAQKSSLIFKGNKSANMNRDSKGVAIFLNKSGSMMPNMSSNMAHIGSQASHVRADMAHAYKKARKAGYNFRCSLIKVYSGVAQFFSWFIFWPLYNILFKIEIEGRQNLKKLKGPLIMVSNHTRFYDSFLYRIIVGFASPLVPMRFMATLRFSDPFMSMVKKTGIIHFVYSLFGVFVVEHGLGLNKNLKRAKDILKNNGVVAMFPEGRLNSKGEVTQFKRGVSALALSSHTKVLPIGIHIKEGNLLKLRRGSIKVRIGTAHYLETHSTYEELAEGLREEVVNLINHETTAEKNALSI